MCTTAIVKITPTEKTSEEIFARDGCGYGLTMTCFRKPWLCLQVHPSDSIDTTQWLPRHQLLIFFPHGNFFPLLLSVLPVQSIIPCRC